MLLSRLTRLACYALALVLAVSAVNLTTPGVFVRAVETVPDTDDDDRELELVAPYSARPAIKAEHAVGYFSHPARFARASAITSPGAARGPSVAPSDPLGSRLRC